MLTQLFDLAVKASKREGHLPLKPLILTITSRNYSADINKVSTITAFFENLHLYWHTDGEVS